MMTTENGKEELSFEESMNKLEELVKKLEEGNLDLDESIKIYSEAVKLKERCRKILDESERKVEILMNSTDGMIKDEFKI